jgi:hypothetical protein
MGKAQCALLPTKTSQLLFMFFIDRFTGCVVGLSHTGERLCAAVVVVLARCSIPFHLMCQLAVFGWVVVFGCG